MYKIVILENNNNDSLITHIEYIFLKQNIEIILFKDLINKLLSNNNFIFINKILYPIKNFIYSLNIILADTDINYCSLSNNNDIFIVKSSNIIMKNNILDIKKENNVNMIFEDLDNSNLIDNIIPPIDINLDYIKLLKLNNTYDNIINFNIAYKSYEKYLKYIVKDNFCYNIILFINNINDLNNIQLPTYYFYRITIFYNFKNKKHINKIKLFCLQNKILSYYCLDETNTFFNLNNTRSIWFEKICFFKNFKDFNITLIEELNNYHKIKDTIILENIISISSSDFICCKEFNNNYITKVGDIFNIINNNINNFKSCYISKICKKELSNKCSIDNEFIENQLMITRNYNLVLDNINKNINDNYNLDNVFKLLIKKISISILCKNQDDIIKELSVLIESSNNIEFLSNLVILLTNFKNINIMNKLYIKILKLTQENISNITMKAFNGLIYSASPMTEEILITVMDFIISSKLKLTKDNLKIIIMRIFINITKFIDKQPILLDKLNTILNDLYDINDIMNIDKLLIELNNKNNSNVCLLHFLIFITTNFSAYYDSYDKFLSKRNDIKKQLEYIKSINVPTCSLKEVIFLPVCNFYLSYQGISSEDIFILKSDLIRKICPELNFEIDLNFINKKINICFHSNYLTRWHSVFKDRHIIIKELSKYPEYNIYFTTFDDLTDDVKYLFGNATHIKLSNNLIEIKEKMINLKLDILVYCEIGMDPKSYFMAHMRLAKKQINTWGHSDTSGINSIDYFISSKYYELPYELSQLHYSEKLILLDSLCTSYVNPLSRVNINLFTNRLNFGFTDELTIYFCAQSLFKFNPIFDEYIINILNHNNNFILIILNSENKEKIFQRFNNKNISSRIHIFPMMNHFQYMNLMHISDVILDPYPFGGCNSSLESFALNKVVVTHESNMINGRFTSGFYKKMNLENIITNCKEDYINLAIKLGTDIEYRKLLENKIINNNNCLFNDTDSILDWKKFIDRII